MNQLFWMQNQALGRKPSVSDTDFTLPAVSDMNIIIRTTLHVPIEPEEQEEILTKHLWYVVI